MKTRSTALRKLVRTLRGERNRLQRHGWQGFEDHDPEPVLRMQQVAAYELARALQLADTGDYGTCIDCGATIALKRLRARPTSLRCIRCQERLEASTAA